MVSADSSPHCFSGLYLSLSPEALGMSFEYSGLWAVDGDPGQHLATEALLSMLILQACLDHLSKLEYCYL